MTEELQRADLTVQLARLREFGLQAVKKFSHTDAPIVARRRKLDRPRPDHDHGSDRPAPRSVRSNCRPGSTVATASPAKQAHADRQDR
ncbi:hypothetical protein [Paraburkholderia sp. BL6665CI2N2]|uniref:hypothetical protein n=1 Tax=Paraburkholderia sp. BL6665CI2N2 TaxID=1938806 RepID=UPI001FB96C5B|nr:hypothetical protein [Paraburkholderia sp. BL6665CI2N2]